MTGINSVDHQLKLGFEVATLDGTNFSYAGNASAPRLPLLIMAYDSADAASRWHLG